MWPARHTATRPNRVTVGTSGRIFGTMGRTAHTAQLGGMLVIAALLCIARAEAAGTAYGVDTAEVSDPGNCKVESWLSWASNQDFLGITNPSCVFDFGRPTELSVQLQRSRADGEWGTFAAPKFKTNLIPSGIGTFGVAIAGGAAFDLITRETLGFFAYIPATMRLSETMRMNVNAGWQWNRIDDVHFFSYGVGFDWRTPDNVWTLTAEVFGLVGQGDPKTVGQPRYQLGVRWRPVDRFSMDVILGRNITGENANWITLATSIRFPGGDKPEKER